MNNKGSGLIDYILVFPILFFLIFGLVDFRNVIVNKKQLSKDMEYIIELYKEDNIERILSYSHENDFKVNYSKIENGVEFTLNKNIFLKTPFIDKFIDNPYQIIIKKILENE